MVIHRCKMALCLTVSLWVGGLASQAIAGSGNESKRSVTEEKVANMQLTLLQCSGNGCNGLDPAKTTCASGSVTVASRSIYSRGDGALIGKIELRWSPLCKTNWARTTRIDGDTVDGLYATIYRRDGLSYPAFGLGTVVWSSMVYAPADGSAKACGLIDQSYIDGQACTIWR